MNDPVAGFMKNGAPVTKGTCSVCGSRMNLVGLTDAHAGLERPVVAPKESKPAAKAKTGMKPGSKKNVKAKAGTKGSASTAGKRSASAKGKKLVIVESPVIEIGRASCRERV